MDNIYKYIDKTKIFKEISRLKINHNYPFPEVKLKYFYNPLKKKNIFLYQDVMKKLLKYI